jgi:hypothetical protein
MIGTLLKGKSLKLLDLSIIGFVFDADQSARPYFARSGGNFYRLTLFPARPMSDVQQLVNTMKKLLLATVAIVAFSAPSLAQTPKTTGQAPPSFYLAQDTATMKCQIVETEPVAGSSMKVVGAVHSTKASAEAALKADKTCK